MKSIVDIRIARPERSTPIAQAGRPLGSTAKATLDLESARAITVRLTDVRLRDLSPSQLNGAISELTRAGVSVETRQAMVGKTLLGQLLDEAARRANRDRVVPDLRSTPGGPYSTLVAQANAGHNPPPHHEYR